MPMNPEIKTEWVSALRNGGYEQGKRALHNHEANLWCCLGVLCDLAVKAGVVTEDKTRDHKISYYGASMLMGVLPWEVYQWAGLDTDIPSILVNGYHHELTLLNDEKGYDFQTIASLIEQQL